MDTSFYFAKDFLEDGISFIQDYDLLKVITMPERKPANLKKPNQRVCRFCGKDSSSVTFRKAAHIIPELLGNHHLISDFECDECNIKFGTTYEDHLANFLGIGRTLSGVRGKEKSPKFKSADKKMTAAKENIFGTEGAIVVTDTEGEGKGLTFNPVEGTGLIEVTKQPYKPIWVYKAFLKMALSCIDEPLMRRYTYILRFLMGDALDQQLAKICNVRAYRSPLGHGYKEPFVMLFYKKDAGKRIPSHLFALFFQNSVYEIFLPLNFNDQSLYNGEPFNVYWCPPMFADPKDATNVPVKFWDYDLSSTEMKRDDKETIHFQTDEGELKNIVRMNVETGAMTPPLKDGVTTGMKKLILVPPGTQIDVSQFKKK
jgi:hypothetical protein